MVDEDLLTEWHRRYNVLMADRARKQFGHRHITTEEALAQVRRIAEQSKRNRGVNDSSAGDAASQSEIDNGAG